MASHAPIRPALAAFAALGLLLGACQTQAAAPSPTQATAPSPTAVTHQRLQGTWSSTELTRQEWIDRLLAMGHDRADLDATSVHDPISARVSYLITIRGDEMDLSSSTDGGAAQLLSPGRLRLIDASHLGWTEVVAGVPGDCEIALAFTLEAGQLSFGPFTSVGCTLNADERIANDAFFHLTGYRQGSGS